MRARGGGRIVNISSIGGKVSVPHLLPYSPSKFALTGLSEGLRAELMKDNILATTVCPGLMRTGSPRNAWFKGRRSAESTWFAPGGNFPGLSMAAGHAAASILDAARYGEAEVVIGQPAPDGGASEATRGHESESRWTESPPGTGNRAAAERYNQV